MLDLDFVFTDIELQKEQIDDFIENRLFQIVEEAFKEHKESYLWFRDGITEQMSVWKK